MASTSPWKIPGASGEPVSAITSIVIESAVTPVSPAASGADLHALVTSAAPNCAALADGVVVAVADDFLSDRPQDANDVTTARTAIVIATRRACTAVSPRMMLLAQPKHISLLLKRAQSSRATPLRPMYAAYRAGTSAGARPKSATSELCAPCLPLRLASTLAC